MSYRKDRRFCGGPGSLPELPCRCCHDHRVLGSRREQHTHVTASNATTLTAQFAVASGTTLGPRSITVTTGSEEATLPSGFRVQ